MAMPSFPLLLLLSQSLLCGALSAQAPADWTRLADGNIVEKDGHRIIHLGPWRSPDSSRTVMVANLGELKDVQALNDFWAGLLSGVMQKKLLPLKYEFTLKPRLVLTLRGQMEAGGTITHQDLHLVLTRNGAVTVHVYGAKPDLSIDLAKWDLGEPIQDEDGKFAGRVQELIKIGNGSLAKYQDLVRKLRAAPEEPAR